MRPAVLAALALAALALAVSLAGCLGADEDPGPAADPDASAQEGAVRTLFLAPDGSLVATEAETGGIGAGDFILKWVTGSGAHPALAGPGGLLVSPQNVEVTLWIESNLPVLPASGVLPDVAAWFGADGHTPLVASAATGPLLPGTPVEVSFPLGAPSLQGPLVARHQLDLIVTVTMTQLDLHGVRILTGAEHPSRVTFHAAPLPRELLVAVAPETVALAGLVPFPDRIIGPLPVPALNFVDISVPVGGNASHLKIHIAATGGGHTVDMDMVLLEPGGEVVSWGVTPYAEETILVQGAALAPWRGTGLTLRVGNHLGLLMEFEGTLEQG